MEEGLIILYEHPTVTVEYLEDKKIVRHKYTGFVHGEPLRNGLLAGNDALKKYNAHKWLSDNRDASTHNREDTDWINSVWIEQAIQAGWKKWALIQPVSVISQMNQKEFIQTFRKKGVEVMVFSDPAEGMAWLEKD